MDIKFFDLHRIFIGDAPAWFLLEIVFRTLVMYSYTILLLRFLGKRGMGQLSTLEVAIIISFGSAVGDPMMAADIPIFHGMMAVTTIAFLQVGLERVVNRNKKLEQFMEGKPDCLIDDGIILINMLKESNLSHEDLFRAMRSNEVEHLGEVKKAFFETTGNVSVLFHSKRGKKAGLSVIPRELIPEDAYFSVDSPIPETRNYSCTTCGFTAVLYQGKNFKPCPKCDCREWTKADEH